MSGTVENGRSQGAGEGKSRRWFVALFALALVAVSGISIWTNLARSERAPAAVPTGLDTLVIETAAGPQRFQIEVMRTDADRAKGLMFRQHMPADRGMLFDFPGEQIQTMWMRNTFIPLDMIFIRADGRVHRVEANTEPHSERTISSGAPVRAVLELNAGTAARIGLKPGDRVRHAIFPR